MGHTVAVLIGCAGVVLGCTSVGDYSTDTGECYEGGIVAADYLRSNAFAEDVKLTLTLEADRLGRCDIGSSADDAGPDICREGARISTHDSPPTFQNALVRPYKQLSHDALSLLQFPGGRVRNYLAYASPELGPPAMVVISLMENDEVEVRILRAPGETEAPALFGVFRLVRKEGCDTPHAGVW